MKYSIFLYELVLKLNRQEKRFINIYLSKKNTKNNHLDFFKILTKLKSTDESLIKKKLVNSPILKNFSLEKNLLYNLILRGLNDFHQELDARTQVNDLLKNVSLLIKKTLFHHAQKRLEKAKKIAYAHDFNDLVYSIIEYERIILFALKLHTLESNSLQIKQLNEAYTKLDNLTYYKDIEGQVFYHRLKHDTEAGYRVLENPYLQNYEGALSIEAKILFNHCILLCNNGNANFDISQNNQQLLDIFINNRELLIDQINRFALLSSNRIRFLMNFNKFEQSKNKLEELIHFSKEIIPLIRPEQQMFFRFILLSNQLFLFFRTKEYKKVIDLKEDLLKNVYKNEDNINPIACISCYGVMGTASFYLQEDAEALFWFQHILDKFAYLPNVPHRKVVSFIIILCHFNLENIAIVPHLARAFHRKYLKDGMNVIEKKVIRFLEYDVNKSLNTADLQEKIQDIYQDILAYEESKVGDLSWMIYAKIWLNNLNMKHKKSPSSI